MPFTPNRRSFIIASGMTALASTRVLGANDTLRVGIIGAGGRMRTLLDCAEKTNANYQIVAVSDVYGPRRDEVKTRSNGIATTHLDYHEVLAKDIDVVMIASNDHWHVRMACDALAAGKDVYLEKPVTHTIEEGATLAHAVHSSKQVLQCGMQQRSWTHFRSAVDLIQGGSLGRVTQVRTYWWQNYNQTGWKPKPIDTEALDWKMWLGGAPDQPFSIEKFYRWRWFWNFGGGGMTDLFTHWIDVAQWMLDDPHPKNATALGGIYQLLDQRQNPDTVSAIVQYDGWNLNFESSVLSIRNDHPSVFFEGTEGTLDLSRDGYTYTPNQGTPSEVSSTESLERAHTRNFLDAIVSGAQINAPLKAGIEASLPIQMALKSYWSHKRVSQSQLA